MKPLIKSLMLYLLIVGLLIVNVKHISDFPLSGYIIYTILIFVVIYSGESLFWGKRLAPGLLS
ncbi:MAG: hypothetical protein KKD69_02075, partial [Euryarchaeota archaeon]|nr:hypothetical protein [Euryarchaeota archaeon]